MVKRLSWLVVMATAGLAGPAAAPGAPKPADKESEQEKAIRIVVAKVVAAFGKHDIDALVELSEVPFNPQPGAFARSKDELRRYFKSGLEGKPKYDGKHEIKLLQTFKQARTRLSEEAIRDYQEVLTDTDFVIHVEIQIPDRRLQSRVLIKMVDGQPRFAGLGKEDRS